MTRLTVCAVWRETPSLSMCPLSPWTSQAVAAWHDAGYMHMDIKPDNVGMDKHGHVRLLDADHSRRLEEAAKHPFAGTREFGAPELTRKKYPITPAVDVYGVGATIAVQASPHNVVSLLRGLAAEAAQ